MKPHTLTAVALAAAVALAVPASADSIPSSAMQEDHVSMGWSAARKLRTSVDNLTRILAVELYAAARAVELREGLTPAPATRAVLDALRGAGVEGPGPDRYLAPDLEAADAFVRDGRLVEDLNAKFLAAATEILGDAYLVDGYVIVWQRSRLTFEQSEQFLESLDGTRTIREASAPVATALNADFDAIVPVCLEITTRLLRNGLITPA